MSILLDALKKSERRQRAGEVPGLAAEPSPMATDAPGGGFARYLLVVIPVLVAIGWLSWQQYRPLDQAGPSVGEVAHDTRPAAGVPVEAAPAADEADERVAQESAEADAPTQMAPRTPVEEALPEVAEAPVERSAATRPSGQPAESRAEPPTAPPDNEATAALREPSPATSTAPAGEELVPTAQSGQDSVIGYWELPGNIRNSLPPLRVTVLVYSEVPGDRFALVDGQRVHQTDELDGGVRVAHIRRDGVVFRRGAYRFLVKP